MRRKEQNLFELWHRFDTNTCAAEALDEMKAYGNGAASFDLKDLLRYHGDEEVDDESEVAMRDAFDDLLAFYGCVEIAAIIGFLPTPLPREFRSAVTQVLCNRHVRRYYRKHYPLLLPDMLLARISDVKTWKEKAASETGALFFEFLQLSNILDENSSVQMLLWFLDDGDHNGYDWQSTLGILTKPRKLVKTLGRAPRSWNAAEQAVDGLRKFLGFCEAFDDLLTRSKTFPLFQAAIWHYHSYWFRILRGEVREALAGALCAFESWLLSPAAKQLSKDGAAVLRNEAATSLEQVRKVVRRLTGTRYGKTLTIREREIRSDSGRALFLLAAHATEPANAGHRDAGSGP